MNGFRSVEEFNRIEKEKEKVVPSTIDGIPVASFMYRRKTMMGLENVTVCT